MAGPLAEGVPRVSCMHLNCQGTSAPICCQSFYAGSAKSTRDMKKFIGWHGGEYNSHGTPLHLLSVLLHGDQSQRQMKQTLLN